MYKLNNNVSYFESFGVKQIPEDVKKFIDNSTVLPNIFRIQAYDSIMNRYFCIGFIDFMLKRKNCLTDFSNFFSLNSFKKHDEIILNYFENRN